MGPLPKSLAPSGPTKNVHCWKQAVVTYRPILRQVSPSGADPRPAGIGVCRPVHQVPHICDGIDCGGPSMQYHLSLQSSLCSAELSRFQGFVSRSKTYLLVKAERSCATSRLQGVPITVREACHGWQSSRLATDVTRKSEMGPGDDVHATSCAFTRLAYLGR